MRLHRLNLRGISTAFRASTVEIDFDAIPPGLVAIVGENGAGKTTVLEATGPLVLYRRSPSYEESLVERVVPGVRDAQITLDFSIAGTPYRATVRADPMAAGGRGKTEAVLSTGDNGGQPHVIAGPLVREFDAKITEFMPPDDVFLASAFAAQGGIGSFFTMSPADRREVLVTLLGLWRLQRCAELADERRQALVTALAVAQQAVAAAEVAWAERERLRGEYDEAGGEVDDAARERDRLAELARVARETTEQTAGKLAAAEAVLAQPVPVPEHDARVDEATRTLHEAEQTATRAEGAATAAAQAHAALVRSLGEIRGRRQRLQDQIAASSPPDLPVEALDVELRALLTKEADVLGIEKAADAALADAHRRHSEWAIADASQTRDLGVAELLGQIPGVPECERCPLTEDARAARDRAAGREVALSLPRPDVDAAREALVGARTGVIGWKDGVAAIREDIGHAQRYAALMVEWGQIEVEHARAMTEQEVAEHELSKAQAALTDVRETSVAVAIVQRAAAVEARNAAVAAATEQAKHAVSVARQEHEAKQRGSRLAHELHEQATHEHSTAMMKYVRLNERMAAAEKASAQIDAARAEAEQYRQAVTDWSLTARVLGKEGAQALAIDAAGPGISTLANELLAACYGTRFALRFVTSEPKKSGDGWKEVMTVELLDAEQGRVAKRGSGGEMVVLDEALRLAIALYNVRHHGFACETLWRDETAGALSPVHAERYVALLRKARELGGFHHVLFIAHQEAVWRQAESQLHVAGGRVTVRAA